MLSNEIKATTFAITDIKFYVPVVTLSTQDNAKLLPQLKSGFKRNINWNKYQSKVSIQTQNPYLDYLTDPSFQDINRIFVLSFENTTDRTVHTKSYLPTVEIKDDNVVVDGQNFSDQPVKTDLRTYKKIQRIAIGQRDGYTIGCLLDYKYFNKHYKMIEIDLSKQQALYADLKAMQQINFRFFTRNCESIIILFCCNIISI